ERGGVGFPYPRSNKAFAAATRAAGGAFSSCMMLASVVMASGDFWRASSCTSPNTFGRPPGVPLTPLGNGLPLPGIIWLFLCVVSEISEEKILRGGIRQLLLQI